ncbi:MAG: indole-3-glycerol phosphate synthase TrpC [Proteobacteria bacterium]|nr:indole-3-glycerol phosphate synthase TrpC [Pseudomonadota bacterium]
MTILDEILEHKRGELAEAKRRVSPAAMAARAEAATHVPRGFAAALAAGAAPVVIAELKRRSPSKGLIRQDFDPVKLAKAYADGGAAALSVLTDEHYFGGRLEFLAAVRSAVSLPLLRKDFVVEAYQIDEARAAGADAVLLIAGPLGPEQLSELHAKARARGLDALIEVHDERQLEMALAAGARLIGVNNRDLRSFDVDLAATERIAAQVPDEVLLVSESGIFTPEDIARLERAGARAFLVGESLMREADVVRALERLRRTP